MEQLLKKITQIIQNNKRQKQVRAGIMTMACIVVFMTTYLLILPAITISLDQADEEPGFNVASQGELLFSNEDEAADDDPGANGDAAGLAGADTSGNGELLTFDEEGDASSLFGEADGDSDEVLFAEADGITDASADETAGPFEYTYTDEETEWKVSVKLLEGATLPSDAQLTAQLIQLDDTDSEEEKDAYRQIENAHAEMLQASNLEMTEEPVFYKLSFKKDGADLITEDTFAPAQITFRFTEPAPEEGTAIATGEYRSLAKKAEMRQTLLIPESNSCTIIADLENAASVIGIAKVRKTETEEQDAPETENDPETESYTVTETETEIAEETETAAETETGVREEATEKVTESVTEAAAEAASEESNSEEATEALESVYEDELEEETESVTEEETETETEVMTEAETEELLSVLTYEGPDYTVQLTYGADAEIPEDAFVEVHEIEKGSKEYNMYLAASGIALENEGKEAGSAENVEARFFDITIMYEDQKIEPKGQDPIMKHSR